MLQEEEGVHHHQVEEVGTGVQHQVEEEEVVDLLQEEGEVVEEEVMDLLQDEGEVVEEEVVAQHYSLPGEAEAVEGVVEEEKQPLLDHREVEGEAAEGQRQEGWMVGKSWAERLRLELGCIQLR